MDHNFLLYRIEHCTFNLLLLWSRNKFPSCHDPSQSRTTKSSWTSKLNDAQASCRRGRSPLWCVDTTSSTTTSPFRAMTDSNIQSLFSSLAGRNRRRLASWKPRSLTSVPASSRRTLTRSRTRSTQSGRRLVHPEDSKHQLWSWTHTSCNLTTRIGC